MSHLTPVGFLFETEVLDVSQPLDVSAFQSAFARLCDLCAQALSEGRDRDAVMQAFRGEGADPAFARIRAHRVHVTHRVALVKHHAARNGIGERTVVAELLKAGRMVRKVAEVEWMVTIPIVSPSP